MKRKILLVTERRADYTKLRPILEELSKSKKLQYYLIVTGSHLLKENGLTINEIKSDGFKITKTFSMFKKGRKDIGTEMTRSFARAVMNLSNIIEKIKPDIILTGFDIGANFAAAIIGAHANIIVGHIEGGEVTGTIDDSIRHATTKFAHIHFTSNQDASNRLIKMGELPHCIFTVGNTSLDGIKKLKKVSKHVLEKKYNLDLNKPLIIILQHTVTSEIETNKENILETINAIKEENIPAIIIYGNTDAGSQKITKIIKNSKIKQYKTIPYPDYIGLLKHASALIGNSSSGIIETPYLHVPSINVGTRQDGRLRVESIIDVGYNKNEIKKAINKCISDTTFLKNVKSCKSLYGNGDSAKKLVKILEDIDLRKISIQKKMRY